MDPAAQLVLHAELERRRRLFVLLTILIAQVTYYYRILFLSPQSERIPHHTSILTGEGWMLELLSSHRDSDRMKISLGVGHDVFNALVQILAENGIQRSRRGISVEEQLGIFLHSCVTGLSSRHVGERFQHSPATITKYVTTSSVCLTFKRSC